MASDALARKIQDIEDFIKDYPEAVADEDEAKCVYSAIDIHLKPLIHELDEAGEPVALPPASMVIYTAKRLAQLCVRPSDIPALLHILENVEALRRQAVEEAGEILTSSQGKKLKRRKALEKIADEEDAEGQRLLYLYVIVLSLVRLCLCYLWKKNDSASLWRLMRETFPSLFIKDEDKRFKDGAWKAFVHTGLTIKERQQFHEHGKALKDMLAAMKSFDNEWRQIRALEDDEDLMSQYERMFDEKFTEEMDNTETLLGLGVYLTKVEKMVNVVEDALNS